MECNSRCSDVTKGEPREFTDVVLFGKYYFSEVIAAFLLKFGRSTSRAVCDVACVKYLVVIDGCRVDGKRSFG